MRLLRARRRDEVICVAVEVFGYEIEQMVRAGLLRPEQRDERREKRSALGSIIESWYLRKLGA